MAAESPERPEIEETRARLDRVLRGVREPAQRSSLVLEALEARDAAGAYALISAVLGRAPSQGSAFDLLRDTLHGLLLSSPPEPALDYDRRSDIYEEANRAGDETVLRALRAAPPLRSMADGNGGLSRKLSDTPLGRRRSLARGSDMRLLEELARDSDARVIANLLMNPRTCEDDVARMAALRPVATSTLIEIDKSSRWSPRARIRAALARNPYCPVDIALKALGTLPLAELREMSSDAGLHSELREQVAQELARRRSTP
jgi:hypothetical protein